MAKEAKKMFGSGRISHFCMYVRLRLQHRDKLGAAEYYNALAFSALLGGDFEQALKHQEWCKIALIQKLKLPTLSPEQRLHDLKAVCEAERRIALTKDHVPPHYDEQVAYMRALVE